MKSHVAVRADSTPEAIGEFAAAFLAPFVFFMLLFGLVWWVRRCWRVRRARNKALRRYVQMRRRDD